MDREFECICDSVPGEANFNITATNYTVPDID